jgi:two-component sensor histidine kinase
MTSLLHPHVEAPSTIAVIAACNEPLLFLDGDQTLIAASTSFCRTFEVDPATVPGTALAELGNGEWAIPQLASLLKATASRSADVEAYELDLVKKDGARRHLVLNARRLEDGDDDHVRLLLSITDVTAARVAARQNDDLLREKAVLLQEVQHRVANSLQIIASVLMQGARRVQSAEARGYLNDAHHRVLSIAAVQRQLAQTSLEAVVLRAYFLQLCESLGASMISDDHRLSIVVTVDDSIASADTSVRLGLIVTELVINALKHAFGRPGPGRIMVDYRSDGSNWLLSVVDDGVGMPVGDDAPKPGLGTGIVEALAKQLGGQIQIDDAEPGTSVSIGHGQVRPVRDDFLPVAVGGQVDEALAL